MPDPAAEDSPHPVDIHVGRRISEKRRSLGYNQSDLARALGLTFQQVQKYERGTNRISSSKLWVTADFLGVDLAYFFEGLPGFEDRTDGRAGARATEPSPVSQEIARLSRRLSVRQQRNLLAILEDLSAPSPPQAPTDT